MQTMGGLIETVFKASKLETVRRGKITAGPAGTAARCFLQKSAALANLPLN